MYSCQSNSLSDKREKFHIRIRKSRRDAKKESMRQQNIKFLQQLQERRLRQQQTQTSIVSNTNNESSSQALLNSIVADMNSLKTSYEGCDQSNWRQLSKILETLFQHHCDSTHSIFRECFEIGLVKGSQYLGFQNEYYSEYMQSILCLIKKGVGVFLGEISNDSILIIEWIFESLFKENKHLKHSFQSLIQLGLQTMHIILTLPPPKQSDCLTLSTFNERKLHLIEHLFYSSPLYLHKLFQILENKYQHHFPVSTKQLAIKIFTALTSWASSPTYIEPLVNINLYEFVYSLLEVQSSPVMNRLIVGLIQNLLLLDSEILLRGIEDGIVLRLVNDVVYHSESVDVDAHLMCLGRGILGLDLQGVDIRNQLDVNRDLEGLWGDGREGGEGMEVFLLGIKRMVEEYNIKLEKGARRVLESIYFQEQRAELREIAGHVLRRADQKEQEQRENGLFE